MVEGSSDVRKHVPFNNEDGFAFVSDVFEGRIKVHLRGLPTTNESLFAGKKRRSHTFIQVSVAPQLP